MSVSELEFDYFKDLSNHVLLGGGAFWVGSPLDAKTVYAVRWMTARRAGLAEFNPSYTIIGAQRE